MLHHAFICKTEIAIVTYYDMIDHFDIKKPCGFPDFVRQFFICLAGFQISRGMIMTENQYSPHGIPVLFLISAWDLQRCRLFLPG